MAKKKTKTVRFVELEKQSKRQQKEHHAAQRGSWNGVNPVSRIIPNKKAYDRKRTKSDMRRLGAFA